MAPFSMKCTTCGEFIYRGRKFNARKEIPEERYLNIQIFRFYIRCTRCSAEIVFKTDPRNQDYQVERGAKRNVDPWKRGLESDKDETDEARLDRIEREMAAEGDESLVMEERNAMAELEAKTADAKREMAVADALDEIRSRNARLAKAQRDGVDVEVVVAGPSEEEEKRRRREEEEDAEAARRAFAFARTQELLKEPVGEGEEMIVDGEREGGSWRGGDTGSGPSTVAGFATVEDTESVAKPVSAKPAPAPATVVSTDMPPPPTFKRQVKKKKDHSALLGIKKKPSLV